jgi:hypothetical protein
MSKPGHPTWMLTGYEQCATGAQQSATAQSKRKVFFFEKKKQKTFAYWLTWHWAD